MSQQFDLAVSDAEMKATELEQEFPHFWKMPESEQMEALQEGFVNFYSSDASSPYVALAAAGPWIISSKGAVIHDSGGYGMLGLGHNPEIIQEPLSRKQVMANVMTPSFSQARFMKALRAEIGHSRKSKQADGLDHFFCLNSGSEAMTLALRLSDIRAKKMTDPGGPKAGWKIKLLSVSGAFHGRTDRPAEASHSSMPKYKKYLASFRDRDSLITVPENDEAALEKAFREAQQDKVYIEAIILEPIMGEGNPGVAVSVPYYKAARDLSEKYGAYLIMDAIQAGIRTHGTLSVVDYPGFQELPAPDMESYSKALNAGQYPLSVLAVRKAVADTYETGLYGNTMTTNPRALDIGTAVLENLKPALRKNIVERGREFKQKLEHLKAQFPALVTAVTGTGLLVAIHFDEKKVPVMGDHGLEKKMRCHGIGVIHGGKNALRFTPHFALTSPEIDLVMEVLGSLLQTY